eukprot:SAG31_NODE_12924_length_906_cov_1.085502_2_plen_165_part_01
MSYDWAGTFQLPSGSYTWENYATVDVYDDARMNAVLLPSQSDVIADATVALAVALAAGCASSEGHRDTFLCGQGHKTTTNGETVTAAVPQGASATVETQCTCPSGAAAMYTGGILCPNGPPTGIGCPRLYELEMDRDEQQTNFGVDIPKTSTSDVSIWQPCVRLI